MLISNNGQTCKILTIIGKLYKFILSVAIELCRETKFVNENVPWGLRFAS